MSTAIRQQALTLRLRVRPGRVSALESLLAEHQPEVEARLRAVPSLHFASFSLVPTYPPDDGRAELVLETTFDHELATHLDELASAIGDSLQAFAAECEGTFEPRERASFRRSVHENAIRSQAFHLAHAGLSVAVIRNDAALRGKARQYLRERERGGGLCTADPLSIASALQQELRAGADLFLGSVAREPAQSEERGQIVGALVAGLRFELTDRVRDWFRSAAASASAGAAPPPIEVRGERGAAEQQVFAHVAVLKGGRERMRALVAALSLIEGRLRAERRDDPWCSTSALHSARWSILPDGRLLFVAHHDGATATLLDRLSETVSVALALIWSHAEGFPPTRLLVSGGARARHAFLAWVRRGQLRSGIWYSAYPELSVIDVDSNHRVRELMARELDVPRARQLCAMV